MIGVPHALAPCSVMDQDDTPCHTVGFGGDSDQKSGQNIWRHHALAPIVSELVPCTNIDLRSPQPSSIPVDFVSS